MHEPARRKRDWRRDEWRTPGSFFQVAFPGLTFDVDPASPESGYDAVPARRRLTKKDDALHRVSWGPGLAWLNPPFGRALPAWLLATVRMRIVGTETIVLCPVRSDTAWFHRYVPQASAVMLLKGRVRFVRPNGKVGDSPGFPMMLLAFGRRAARLIRRVPGALEIKVSGV